MKRSAREREFTPSLGIGAEWEIETTRSTSSSKQRSLRYQIKDFEQD